LNDISEDRVRQHVLTLQIILGALAAGLTTYLVVVLVIRGLPEAGGEPELLTYCSVGFFFMMLVASSIMPRVMVQAQLSQISRGAWKPSTSDSENADFSTEAMQLLAVHQTQAIVRWAMLEGAGFFALTAYQLEGHWLSMAAALLVLALLLLLFPTRGRVENWIERQREHVNVLRQLPQYKSGSKT
jgi:high-affinity Fe2+/Pb2+ permease